MKTEIVPAREAHAEFVASNMRTKDKIELSYMTDDSPYDALLNGIRTSREAHTVLMDGTPVLVFGVRDNSLVTSSGIIWMLSTDLIEKISFRFVRHSRDVVKTMMLGYEKVFNYVWVENDVSIKWLTWLGFTIHEAQPFGWYKKPFCYFEMKGTHYV